jgi:cell fate regulator YaaT (PSP1 superfamily)
MDKVVGVTFNDGGRTYFFSTNNLEVKKGTPVIVETERGLQYAKVVTNTKEGRRSNFLNPLKKIIRVATEDDYKVHQKNLESAKKALKDCNELIKKHNLDMRLLNASFTFDRKQLVFNFLSDNRVDFRGLVRDLAQIYKTRIELRQIGVRDKAKVAGGIGPCGRVLCCAKFLSAFDSVSINMAKNQNLALNPSKINGACGRLLCCLNYEDDNYKALRKGMPDIGKTIKTPHGEGKVTAIDILNRTYKVYVEEHGEVEVKLDK